MVNILAKIFGTHSDREIKRMRPIIEEINKIESTYTAMSDAELAAQTDKFREQLKKGATLDDIMVPAFAVVREASRRNVKMRDFDVQLMGGKVLHDGKIAEMKTGEGKTLVATLAVYLNALEGKGVHVVTVNDYLAKRDAEWMGKVYKSLGLTVGSLVHEMEDLERKKAYACDITYGTNTEYGFDYLRDNMKFAAEDRVQRGHNFAIVDEVDSILIDEARTPLIISGPSNEATDIYYKVEKIISNFQRGEELNADDPDLKTTTGDFIVDEKRKSVTLTDDGITKAEQLLGLSPTYDADHMEIIGLVQTALKAQVLFEKDIAYVVKYKDRDGNYVPREQAATEFAAGKQVLSGEVIIVDEFTGRLMPGRRWNESLHQAVEAKEGLKVEAENQTLATITLQNYFRMYKKLAGMTGTAQTEEAEFGDIYKLDVVAIPANKESQREDFDDLVYFGKKGKFRSVARDIKEMNEKTHRPILIGTVSIERSEELSELLTSMGVKHKVLNAKNPEEEAAIVAQAGRLDAVTVSTNMAGRGTDIVLGGNPDFMAKQELVDKKMVARLGGGQKADDGLQADGQTLVFSYAGAQYAVQNDLLKATVARYKLETDKEHEEVVKLGGLHIVGTERHESRRIDNQLRGRAGRQGDPGSSRFYISLEDHLARVFGGEKLKGLMGMLGMTDEDPIESKMVSNRIEKAQKNVESQNYQARKQLIEYDDVMNKQREITYAMRNPLMDGLNMKESLYQTIADTFGAMLDRRFPDERHSECDWTGLSADVQDEFGIVLPVDKLKDLDRKKAEEAILQLLHEKLHEKEDLAGEEQLYGVTRLIRLSIIDTAWKDHLYAMDRMKEGVWLRGYAQEDPLRAFKKEAYEMFVSMMSRIDDETMRAVFSIRIATQEELGGQIPVGAVANQFSAAAQPSETAPEARQPEPVAVPASAPAPKKLPGTGTSGP
ncbi:MAG: preprotein translocase subunit SecA [Alphaproteobacteria bacterium]|nr:MAG: preprotein translocase subunit SecA [Alphaproteobacteria bacterium]